MTTASYWTHIIGTARRIGVLRVTAPTILASLLATAGGAQTARQVRGAAAVEPVESEPPAKIVVDPPLVEALSHGRVVIQFRTENLHITPVFGPAALAVSPRVGHIHVTLDNASWVWVDASGDPVILNGLPAGLHTVRLDLETANHQRLDQGAVTFTVPGRLGGVGDAGGTPGDAAVNPLAPSHDAPAKLIVDAPVAEPLSRGVLFVRYHAENLHIVPVFGRSALAVSPRVGHIHVTVDDAPWHWADASGNPIIINGLPRGPHVVLIQLVDPDHHPIDQGVVQFSLP
jgi:hypothetical protein